MNLKGHVITRIIVIVLLCIGSIVRAGDLPQPKGPVILTVSGEITHTNGDGVARFDLEMLGALEQRTTTATTPWLDEANDFTGPLGSAILEAVGARGQTLKVTALNDYFANIPVQDFHDLPVIFATHIDGHEMSVRDKGPLFIIYPFDEFPGLFNEIYFGRSVWQIVKIDIQN